MHTTFNRFNGHARPLQHPDRAGLQRENTSSFCIATTSVPRNGALVLLVEDEPEVAEIVGAYLRREGYAVRHAINGPEALAMHRQHSPDLIVLDINLPILDGWSVLAEIRRTGLTPIIMLTANDQDSDKLSALRIGADDYVVKPFNPAEVVLRCSAILRRATGVGARSAVLKFDAVTIDRDSHIASVKTDTVATPLSLTGTEYKLLLTLAEHPQRVFSRSLLIERCLSQNGWVGERTVDSHLSKLRKKLVEAGAERLIVNVRNIGYRLR